MLALAQAIESQKLDAAIRIVVAPSSHSSALAAAAEHGLHTAVVPYEPAEDYADRLLRALADCDLLCLAGYMKLLPKEFLDRFGNRVLNIHPALLPKFGGRGMYGMAVHEAVLLASETESGCTVHWVNSNYDEGAIVLQATCPVEPNDTVESLAKRVLKCEHDTYWRAVQKVLQHD